MRAILIATGEGPGVAPLDERYPVPLLPLADRPFIQHVVEHLVSQGIRRFEFVLSHLPEKLEQFLGDGARWGCRFHFHLARDPARPYRLLRALKYEEEVLLLGHADRLPPLPLADIDASPTDLAPLLFTWRNPAAPPDADLLQWTGWALITPDHLTTLPGEADEKDLEDHLRSRNPRTREVATPLSMETYRAILTSHRAVLAKEFPGLLLGGREVEPGVWLSRNVVLQPTAQVTPPVYLAEDCRIGAGVHLGPFAVVGKGCVLDDHSIVTDAVIFPGSYVGEGLELADVLVDRNRLMNAQLGGVTVVEDFLLGSLRGPNPVSWVMTQLGRLLALVTVLATSPLLLLLMACNGLHRKQVVRLPATTDETTWETYHLLSLCPPASPPLPGTWRDFWLRFLPGLVNVGKGDLGFVGVPPRHPDEIRALPPDWQSLYLHAKAGLVTEEAVRYGAAASEDERYAADGFYAVAAGWTYDLKLLLRYLGSAWFGMLGNFGRKRPEPPVPVEDVSTLTE